MNVVIFFVILRQDIRRDMSENLGTLGILKSLEKLEKLEILEIITRNYGITADDNF